MKVLLKKLWESGGSLERFGALKFKGHAVAYRAGRIHRGAMQEIETLREAYTDLHHKYGVEIEEPDENGKPVKYFRIPPESSKKFKAEWDKLLSEESGEFYGRPFRANELPGEFWGVGDAQPMMIAADIGALSEWLIIPAEEDEPEQDPADVKTQAANK